MRSHILLTLFVRLPFLVTDSTTKTTTISCGTPVTNLRKPLIVGGEPTSVQGRWPWYASIWHRASRSTHVYVCGGTLLSELYVLTAGHCVSKNGNALNERLLTVQLGSVRQNLLLSSFPVQNSAVVEIILHRDFVPRSFHADIALLALRTKVTVNEFVRPVCLPSVGSDELKGRQAVTVGFGMTETVETSDVLRELAIPIVDYVTCLESNREVFGRSLSAGVLCAGDTKGSTVCNGDSGGGLFTEEVDGRWTLRGVTSFTAQRGWNDSRCSLHDYSAFVNVAYYGGWIDYVMNHGEQEGFFKGSDVLRASISVNPVGGKSLRRLRTSEKKCKEYRRKGLTVTGSDGPGHFYLYKNSKTQGLAYYLSDEYAITTAELAIGCIQRETVCETIIGKRIQQVFAHPDYTGGRDFNVALLLIPPADEPLWCLASEEPTKLYFEGRQLKLSAVAEEAPTWMEFDLDSYLPTKRGGVVYNEQRDIAGLMHNPAGELVVMAKTTAVLDWIESVVWNVTQSEAVQ